MSSIYIVLNTVYIYLNDWIFLKTDFVVNTYLGCKAVSESLGNDSLRTSQVEASILKCRDETTNNREKYRKTSHFDFNNTQTLLSNHSILGENSLKITVQINPFQWFWGTFIGIKCRYKIEYH